ncbi:MAG: hypothetical protein ABR575_05630 [Actinomycetota bacterium]
MYQDEQTLLARRAQTRAFVNGIGEVGFSALIRTTWRIFRTHIRGLLRVLVPIYLMVHTLGALAGWLLLAHPRDPIADAYVFAYSAGSAIVDSLLVGAVALRLTAPAAGEPLVRPVGLWRELLTGATAVALISLVPFLLGPVGAFLRVLVEPILGPPVVAHAIALEGRPFGDAWRRAKQLLAGRWGHTFVWLFTIALGVGLASGALIGLLSVGVVEATPLRGLGFYVVVGGLGAGLVRSVGAGFLFTGMLVAYAALAARTAEEDARPA